MVGVKLTGDTAYAVARDLFGAVLGSVESSLLEPTDRRVVPVPATVKVVACLVARLARKLPHLDGVGVSVGGIVRDRAVVQDGVFLGWRDVDLAGPLSGATGTAVIVTNDVTALVREQLWFGAGRTQSNFGLITIGAGLGFGLVREGHVLEQLTDNGHLLAHPPVDGTGPRCELGHHSCTAAYLSRSGIEARVTEEYGASTRFADLVCEEGCPDRRWHTDAARALGHLVALAPQIRVGTQPGSTALLSTPGRRRAIAAASVVTHSFAVLAGARALPPPVDSVDRGAARRSANCCSGTPAGAPAPGSRAVNRYGAMMLTGMTAGPLQTPAFWMLGSSGCAPSSSAAIPRTPARSARPRSPAVASTSTPACCGSAGHCRGRPRDCGSTSPRRLSPAGRCPSPARPSRRCGRTAADRTTSGTRPPAHGGTMAWSSPPRSGHRSSPATSCGGSSSSPIAPVCPAFHLHTLRHSAASFLLAAGTHTQVVQEHLGHSSYAITADIYSHVGPALQREAADRLDQALRW